MNQVVELVAGARPNFVKLAAVWSALLDHDVSVRIVHTGQHKHVQMSGVFFEQLALPLPDVYLESTGGGRHGAQTASILERYEAHLMEADPAGAVVFGDVDGTLAAALAAVKLQIPIAHVEAGLRSFDLAMPEEVNRRLVDAMADLLLVTEQGGVENLAQEGIVGETVRLVGNPMVDTVRAFLPQARERARAKALGLEKGKFVLLTMHRPSNVDEADVLLGLVDVMEAISADLPVIFPVHPRTLANAAAAGLDLSPGTTRGGLVCLGPESYLDVLSLLQDAAVVATDSGGLQAEAATVGTPCVTLRDTTEHLVTVESGANMAVGRDPERITMAVEMAVSGQWSELQPIPLWDGQAGERIAEALVDWL